MWRGLMVVVVLILPALAQASTIEDTLAQPCAFALSDPHMRDEFCTYQYDGGQFGDARDTCGGTDRRFDDSGIPIQGTFIPFDDTFDYYELVVGTSGTVQVTLTPSNPLDRSTYEILVHGGGCGSLLMSGIGYGGNPAITAGTLAAGTYIVGAKLTYVPAATPPVTDGPIVMAPIGELLAVAEVSVVDFIWAESELLDIAISVPTQCEPFCPAQDMDRGAYPRIGYKLKAEQR